MTPIISAALVRLRTQARTRITMLVLEARVILADTLFARGGRAVATAVRSEHGGVFGLSDELTGMLIGIALFAGAIASTSVAKAFQTTAKCASQLTEINLGVQEAVTATGQVPGNGGTINVSDASLTSYLPSASEGGFVDDAAPQGAQYTVTDTSDQTNNVARWLITCPGKHMGLTLLHFRNGSVTAHQLQYDSELSTQAA